jgi:FKBP-type peptidyl-prolyl cis-trans isomerase
MIDLAKEKKLKLSGLDIIFIVDALKAWKKAERDIGMHYTETGLGIKIIKQGEGQLVTVHYTGSLENGNPFDSSYDRGQPISFTAGQGRVIKGWDEAITKLNAGTIALLKIPPDLAYGSRGAGNVIPPGATLYFEIEVISIK